MRRIANLQRVTFVFVPLLVLVAAVAGCGQKRAVAHIKGKVTFKNGTPPNSPIRMIGFQPTENSTAEIRKAAGSNIEPDGSYEVWTRRPGDGINLGDYDVVITVQKSPTDPTLLTPAKYASRATTPFKDVKVDKDNDDLNFEVDMSGGAKTGG